MSLLTEANFFVIIIALIIIFFLLGILFGRTINRTPKEKLTTPTKEIKENTKQIDTQVKDNPRNEDFPDLRQNRRSSSSGNRFYNNYW